MWGGRGERRSDVCCCDNPLTWRPRAPWIPSSPLLTPAYPFDTIPIDRVKHPDGGISPTRHNTHQHQELKKKKTSHANPPSRSLAPREKHPSSAPFRFRPPHHNVPPSRRRSPSPPLPQHHSRLNNRSNQKCQKEKKKKTYNSGYSLVVTHLTTNPPVRCLNRAERTGSLVFNVLWSYVPVCPQRRTIDSWMLIPYHFSFIQANHIYMARLLDWGWIDSLTAYYTFLDSYSLPLLFYTDNPHLYD
jgi:hypothetical protein